MVVWLLKLGVTNCTTLDCSPWVPLSVAFPGLRLEGAAREPVLDCTSHVFATLPAFHKQDIFCLPLDLAMTQFGLTAASWACPCPWPLNMAMNLVWPTGRIFNNSRIIKGNAGSVTAHAQVGGSTFKLLHVVTSRVSSLWDVGLRSQLFSGRWPQGSPSSFHSGHAQGSSWHGNLIPREQRDREWPPTAATFAHPICWGLVFTRSSPQSVRPRRVGGSILEVSFTLSSNTMTRTVWLIQTCVTDYITEVHNLKIRPSGKEYPCTFPALRIHWSSAG